MKPNKFLTLRNLLLIIILLTATGCGMQGGQAINLEGHATDPEGVSRVEIWVNSELTWTVEELPQQGNLVSFAHTWTPTVR